MIVELGHKQKKGNIALKLDMLKAYDRLDCVLRKFSFSHQWVDLIYHTIRNCRFLTMINGEANGFFAYIRGVGQGDPL